MLHPCTDIDPAGDQLASNAERKVALVARLDLPNRLAAIEDRFGIHHNGADRPDFHARVLRRAAGKSQGKGEKKCPRPHGDAPAMNVSVFDIGNLEAGVGSVNFKVGSVNFM